MDNHLFESASEGLFMYKGGNSIIYGNKIYSNYDGIILNQSFPDIKFNKVNENKENGLVLMRNSDPKIQFNNIKDNFGIGIYVRDISEPEIKDNEVDFSALDWSITGELLENGRVYE